MVKDKLVCGVIKNGSRNFTYLEVSLDIIKDIDSGKYNVEILPEPASHIRLIWKNEGYENFRLRNQFKGYYIRGNSIEEIFSEKKISGLALFLQYFDGYQDFDYEATEG